MKNIYCISGLGADERIFMNLRIKDVHLVHIPWPEYDEHDELACYAQKVSALIKEENPIVMGVSLGGMIGVEITKMRAVKKLILISSAKTKSELPPYDGWFGKLMKSNILPPFAYKTPNPLLLDRFGVESDKDDTIIRLILRDSDGHFMKWAMRAVALWQNETFKEPVTHIHGTNDRMIFPENVNAEHWIEGGGHMIVFNRADEISHIINDELANL